MSLAARFPGRADRWQLRTRTLELGTMPLVMGIVNVTPDSFSDGGRFLDHQAAFAHARRLVEEGADLLDIGGESTRPYSAPVPVDEEIRRVLPVVEFATRELSVPVSIDTSKSAVAAAALEAGAEIINDVSALTADPAMVPVAVQAGAGVCAMHMQGTPQTMQDAPQYGDVVTEIHQYLQLRRDTLQSAGIALERIALDPGIGFGKTHQHNLTLLASSYRYHDLGCPLLLGASRKGFIGKVLRRFSLGDDEAGRTSGTIGTVLALAAQGVQVLRVHDVAAVKQALALFAACGGIDGNPLKLDP